MTTILVTGAAGFIGYHVSEYLLARGHAVTGVDDLNPYYDVRLKEARLARLTGRAGFRFAKLCLADRESVAALWAAERPARVVHLAAQAGVRYSLTNPHAYVDSNLVGFMNVLEACRHERVEHLVYASSSSVYGANRVSPFSVHQNVDHPVSLYAATKKANELMAHAYSHLYGLPTTGLRFFTVYGPWGRPDMALFLFTRAILAGQPIDVYNHGDMERDFTYIDDIVTGVLAAIDRPLGFEVINLGNSQTVSLERFIEVLEQTLGVKATRNYLPLQPGDVPRTYADVSKARRLLGWEPTTSIEEGIPRFVDWYRWYCGKEA